MVYEDKIEPPSTLGRVLNFPVAITHQRLLTHQKALDDSKKLQQFKPSNVVYVDLVGITQTINVHAFLFPPRLVDYIKAPFIFGEDVRQIQLITEGFPWIGIWVNTTNGTVSGPPAANLASKQNIAELNSLFDRTYPPV